MVRGTTLLLAMCAPAAAYAQQVTVCPSGQPICDYQRIEEALQSGENDILVLDGTYPAESFNFSTPGAIVQSENGSQLTTVLLDNTENTIDVNNITIKGFKFLPNGGGGNNPFRVENNRTGIVFEDVVFDGFNDCCNAGVLFIRDYASVTVRDSTFSNNYSGNRGGAIYLNKDTELYVFDSVFEYNTSDDEGGAIGMESQRASLYITRTEFTGNQSLQRDGGAIGSRSGGGGDQLTLSVIDSVFSDNTASQRGGAIYGRRLNPVDISGSMFFRNTAPTGGAIYLEHPATYTMYNNVFCQNDAWSGDGGAVQIWDGCCNEIGPWEVRNNVFVENSASQGSAFYNNMSVPTQFSNNTVLYGAGSGQGVYSQNGTFTLTDNLIAWESTGAYVSSGTSSYNGWYANTSDLTGISMSGTDVSYVTAPPLRAYTNDDSWVCEDPISAFYPLWGSSLVDGGEPVAALPDTGIYDLGAFGGPYVDPIHWADGDADGYPAVYDCDDNDFAIHPSATEVADDGIDQDCNGVDATACFVDLDGDLFGDDSKSQVVALDGTCDAAQNESVDNTDCDDTDPTSFPGGLEVVGDGIDQDCSGTDTYACVIDADFDGFGVDSGAPVDSPNGPCSTLEGEATDASDCDDGNAAVNVNATDFPENFVDEDCNGFDTKICIPDGDGDGYGDDSGATIDSPNGPCDVVEGEVLDNTDCDDGDSTINPGETDLADDGIDQDCDGYETVTCIIDADMDGFGIDTGSTTPAPDGTCDTLDGEATTATDCDDGDNTIFPGAPENPGDGIDQNCDGNDTITCYTDGDNDGAGDPAAPFDATDGDCIDPGEAPDGLDCNDEDPTSFPGAVDLPDDSIDQDCNGIDARTCVIDADEDGYGNIAGTTTVALDGTCDTADGEATSADDCADWDLDIHPGATDVADDGVDQDCNGADTITCVVDADSDGYGTDQGTGVLAPDGSCDAPQQESSVATDCNDGSATIYPDAPEVVGDSIDQDCNGADTVSCFVDGDHDGFGNAGGNRTDADDGVCDSAQGEANVAADCVDTDASIYPTAPETIDDGTDQDCNGFDTVSCIEDLDQDGHGEISGTPVFATDGSCDIGDQEASPTQATDCRDDDAGINPDASEVADDGIDQDCSGTDTVSCVVDADTDGQGTQAGTPVLAADGSCDTASGESYPASATDCDDTDPSIFFGASEAYDDGIDQDCNGTDTITCFVDGDLDGFGTDQGNTTLAIDGTCDRLQAESRLMTDCDDIDPTIYPGAAEIAGDGIDQNCDSLDSITCYTDLDLDGYGDPDSTFVAGDGDCLDIGEAATGTDCDDNEITANPGGTEQPDDGIDQDCSGTDAITCIADADMDGYGNSFGTTLVADDGSCDRLDGEGTDTTDCFDFLANAYPGANEIPDDGIDQDCSGTDTVTCFVDADGDGYGTVTGATVLAGDGACDRAQGESGSALDCDDSQAPVFPGASEFCDGIDNDCDGEWDEDSALDVVTWYLDGDGDGFAGSGTSVEACYKPDGHYAIADDCDDADTSINPFAADTCGDFVDSDCDGVGEAGSDEDGDGLSEATESNVGSSDCLWDSDGDLVADGIEYGPGGPARDTDGDGTPDLLDIDDDGDGISTFDEGEVDTDLDSVPNYLDTDSDGDGKLDIDEGTADDDFDGIPNYIDDNDEVIVVDDDGDGLDNATEIQIGTDPNDADSDGDGVGDAIEVGNPANPTNTDGDSLIDALDDDDDDDTIPTSYESPDGDSDPTNDDTDGDGVPNYLDDDDDNDGILTRYEDANQNGYLFDDDTDGDGIPNYLDAIESSPDDDDDGDGLTNGEEALIGSDPDNADSDGDGLIDGSEAGDPDNPTDTDGDGIPDLLDEDDDGDGIATIDEAFSDYDEDGTPDYLDPDSDNDGVIDGVDPAVLGDGGDSAEVLPPDGPDRYGFGCSSVPLPHAPTGLLLALLPLLAVRRRQ